MGKKREVIVAFAFMEIECIKHNTANFSYPGLESKNCPDLFPYIKYSKKLKFN